jgi:hypothetical protein
VLGKGVEVRRGAEKGETSLVSSPRHPSSAHTFATTSLSTAQPTVPPTPPLPPPLPSSLLPTLNPYPSLTMSDWDTSSTREKPIMPGDLVSYGRQNFWWFICTWVMGGLFMGIAILLLTYAELGGSDGMFEREKGIDRLLLGRTLTHCLLLSRILGPLCGPRRRYRSNCRRYHLLHLQGRRCM